MLRLGSRVLLIANRKESATVSPGPDGQPADPGMVAWLGGGDGGQSIDDPMPRMCQLGDHVVALASGTPAVPVPGSGEASTEATPVVPRARVLDSDGHWGPERSGPALDTSTAVGLSGACSIDRLVVLTGRASADGNGLKTGGTAVVSFDPVNQRWGEPTSLQYRGRAAPLMAFPGSPAVVFKPFGDGRWQRIDPGTGMTTPLESPELDGGAYLLTIHGTVGLAFDPKTPTDRLPRVDVG